VTGNKGQIAQVAIIQVAGVGDTAVEPAVIGEEAGKFGCGGGVLIGHLVEVIGQVVVEVAIVGCGGPAIAGLGVAVGGEEGLVDFLLTSLAQFGGDVVTQQVVEGEA
jgi:hypothetical protein